MRKSTYILLNIVSFGLFYLYVKAKANALVHTVNNELTYSQKYSFSINDFLNDLGGKRNIKNVVNTLSSINLELVDINQVIPNLKSKYKIRGISKTSNKLILLFGDNAKQIASDLKQLLV
ncbi:MAG: hypothetical protein L3I91_01535 [Mycoplasma sp.]